MFLVRDQSISRTKFKFKRTSVEFPHLSYVLERVLIDLKHCDRVSTYVSPFVDTNRWTQTILKPGYNEIAGNLQVHKLLQAGETLDISLGTQKENAEAMNSSDDEKPNGNPTGPEQPQLGKTLQQLQGKWRHTRQIATDGDESITPASAIWEFKGDRIIVRDGGPSGAMLLTIDDSHSPVHVDVSHEIDDESGLGLLSIEGDKLIFCLGERQKSPEAQSRPETLQWAH